MLQHEGFSKFEQTRLKFTQQNELHHPLLQFKAVLGAKTVSHQCPLSLSFDQLPWLKNYIILNNHQHTTVKNNFE